uniref:Uncharacterized protein n=1 Tax=Rhizophora mucronata TaxID=61149 RepID=A0A2P2MU63_RHIMU
MIFTMGIFNKVKHKACGAPPQCGIVKIYILECAYNIGISPREK